MKEHLAKRDTDKSLPSVARLLSSSLHAQGVRRVHRTVITEDLIFGIGYRLGMHSVSINYKHVYLAGSGRQFSLSSPIYTWPRYSSGYAQDIS